MTRSRALRDAAFARPSHPAVRRASSFAATGAAGRMVGRGRSRVCSLLRAARYALVPGPTRDGIARQVRRVKSRTIPTRLLAAICSRAASCWAASRVPYVRRPFELKICPHHSDCVPYRAPGPALMAFLMRAIA